MKTIEEILARQQFLKSDRVNWESHWQDALRHANPRKATVTVKGTPGEKRGWQLFDGTMINAAEIAAAGMNTFMTSRVSRWFELETDDVDLMDDPEVGEWLQDTEKRMYRMFQRSNFYSAMHESYLDDVIIGTSPMYIEEDIQDICRFYTRHISECFIAENHKERVDTVFRQFMWTARQAFQEWGEAIGPDIKKFLEKEPDKLVKFLHAVFPREERDPRKSDKRSMPYASLYIYPEKKMLLTESGYQEMPYMVSRWTKESDETYGRSPAMNALAEAKGVNKMRETNIRAGQKQADPPLVVPDSGVIGSTKLTPGGLNVVRADLLRDRIEPHPMKLAGNTRLTLEMENQGRELIRQFFYVDLFLLLMNRPTMTATEVVERNEEKIALLSPVLGRQIDDKLNPVIRRTFGIMARRNQFKPAPAGLQGQKLTVRYVNTLAKAQQMYELKGIQRTFEQTSLIAQVAPEVWDNVDPDMVFDEIADMNAFPRRARRSADAVKKIRDARNKTAQEETEKQDLASGIATAAEAKKSGLLDEIANQGGSLGNA
jgi:hypothetical protein